MAYMKQAEEFLVKLPSISLERMKPLECQCCLEERGLVVDRDYTVRPSGPV